MYRPFTLPYGKVTTELPPPTYPYDNWLRYQAQSLLMSKTLPSLEQARELFETVDINSRRPKPAPQQKAGWFHRLKEAAA